MSVALSYSLCGVASTKPVADVVYGPHLLRRGQCLAKIHPSSRGQQGAAGGGENGPCFHLSATEPLKEYLHAEVEEIFLAEGNI